MLVIIGFLFGLKVLKTDLFLFHQRVLYQINSWQRFCRQALSTLAREWLDGIGRISFMFFNESERALRSCPLSLSESSLI